MGSNEKNDVSPDDLENSPPKIPYRRDRTPSIVVQSLGLSFHKDSNITESIELTGDDDDEEEEGEVSSPNSSSETSDPKSSVSGVDDQQTSGAVLDSSGASARGSQTSLQNSLSPGLSSSPIRGTAIKPRLPDMVSGNRRLSLNIGSTAPRRQSLTVEGLATSFASPTSQKDIQSGGYNSGNATGSLRNKVALKPGHSLMGWIKLASMAKDLSGTNGKIIEVNSEELAKHDKENDCWVALKGNVYNVTTYLQYHPGGVEELMRGAGKDATELFNEVHRWVNYESILAKCLVGPYKLDSPLTPVGRANFATISPSSPAVTGAPNTNVTQKTARKDPTVAQKPPRRQSIALTVPSPNKYQSLLVNNSNTNLNQIQQPPTYVIMQDKSCIKLKIQDLTTLPQIKSRHLICDLNSRTDLHVSVLLSADWLYRVHLHLDQPLEQRFSADFSSDEGSITIQLNKKEASIWNKIGTALDLNDSLCELSLADKFFRPCRLTRKQKLTHDTYLFEFELYQTLMYVPIGWHVLLREHQAKKTSTPDESLSNSYDDRVHKNYTPVSANILDNDGFLDHSGFMNRLYFIIKIYQDGVLTSKLNQLNLGDDVDISDYQCVDFVIEKEVLNPRHWFLFAAGTGITPFCRTISYLLNQSEENVKSVTLAFFNKTQKDIIIKDQLDKLASKYKTNFRVIYVLSEEPKDLPCGPSFKVWNGERGRINKDLVAKLLDAHSPDEVKLLSCGPRAFNQSVKSIATELNLNEKLYIFHG